MNLFFAIGIIKEMSDRLVKNGESREKILEDLGLPSVSYIRTLIRCSDPKYPHASEYIPKKEFDFLDSMIQKGIDLVG